MSSNARRLIGVLTTAWMCGAPLVGWAQDTADLPTYLPPDDQVRAALQERPEVRVAAARVEAASATRRALIVGSHEFEANVVAQRRNVTGEGPSRRYNEWEAEIGRALRWPGKSRLDQEIGDKTRAVADLRLEDAEHQAARRLLEVWMGWLRSAVAAEQGAAQELLIEREKTALARRVALGDAARRELDLMEAERALLAAQGITARDAALAARQTLAAEFPRIATPAELPALPDPQPLPEGGQAWRERIVGESAEIRIADGEATRLAKVAQRARADRTPDPRVGLRMLSERGGAERAVGVVLTIPIGTDYRAAVAATESANAAASEAEADGVRRGVEQAAWMAVQAADSKRQQWLSYQQALDAQAAATTRTRRAWELGEAPLAEYLLAQRNLRQAQLAETQARLDALHAALLVHIDAHALWHSAEPDAKGVP
jgi:outer membrane protein TolC